MPSPEGLRYNPNVVKTKPSLIRAVYALAPQDKPQISLGLGELSYPVPDKVKTAIKSAIIREGTNMYTQNAGIPELRDAVAESLNKRHGIKRDKDDVLITVGSSEALFMTALAFADPQNRLIIPQIGYTAYEADANLVGLKTSEYRLTLNFEPDTDHLVSLLDENPGTKVVILNSPSNPTGQTITVETLKDLTEQTEDRDDVVFVSDDIYEEFVYDGIQARSIAEFLPDKTITIGGLSKTASMTGFRLGWLAGPSEIVKMVAKPHQFAVTCAPSIIQHGALPVVKGECDQDIENFRLELERKRDGMMIYLNDIPELNVLEPKGAFYCFVDVGHYGTSLEVSKRIIQETGVVTIPGRAFGEAGDKYIRISFAAKDSDIIHGIEKMKGVFERW